MYHIPGGYATAGNITPLLLQIITNHPVYTSRTPPPMYHIPVRICCCASGAPCVVLPGRAPPRAPCVVLPCGALAPMPTICSMASGMVCWGMLWCMRTCSTTGCTTSCGTPSVGVVYILHHYVLRLSCYHSVVPLLRTPTGVHSPRHLGTHVPLSLVVRYILWMA